MRELASIQTISSIEPIHGADTIVKATVLGWSVVVKKDEFKIGDLCIYIEIDSIVPEKAEFEFLRQRKFRVRTIKLKNTVSQGLCLPLSYLPKSKLKIKEGLDVTTLMGLIKFDPEGDKEAKLLEQQATVKFKRLAKFMKRYKWYRVFMLKPNKTSFPKFITKTDEERCQRMPWLFEQEYGTKFSVTEKEDGTSLTVFLVKNPFKWMFWKPLLFGVCSRNIHLVKPDNSVYWKIVKQEGIEGKMMKVYKDIKKDLILQGEIIGAGIQENKYKLQGIHFHAFNVKIDNTRVSNEKMHEFCRGLGINTVTILDDAFTLPETMEELITYATDKSVLNSDELREGVVLRNADKNISFKVISPEFLLKHNL